MGENILSMDNVLSEEDAYNMLFSDEPEQEKKQETQPAQKEEPAELPAENEETQTEATEVDSEDLFDESEEQKPESVGGGKKDTVNQEDANSEKDSTSPEQPNFYSSIASALLENGVFPDSTDEEIAAIKEPEDFLALVNKQIDARVDEVTRRVNQALQNGVEPSAIRQYEGTLNYLNSVTEEILTAETEEGETTRRKIIQQDLMNRGYKPERAVQLTEKFFASGDDIEEARSALESNKEYFGKRYKEILDNAKAETEREKKAAKKQAEDLKKDILNTETVLGDIQLDKATRQKVYDSIARPVWKDPETGDYLTAVQKYRRDNENDFIKYMGLFYTLTNGFKDMTNIIKPQAKKEIKSKLKELEHTLSGNNRVSGGNSKYVGIGEEERRGNLYDKGFSIDIR